MQDVNPNPGRAVGCERHWDSTPSFGALRLQKQPQFSIVPTKDRDAERLDELRDSAGRCVRRPKVCGRTGTTNAMSVSGSGATVATRIETGQRCGTQWSPLGGSVSPKNSISKVLLWLQN